MPKNVKNMPQRHRVHEDKDKKFISVLLVSPWQNNRVEDI